MAVSTRVAWQRILTRSLARLLVTHPPRTATVNFSSTRSVGFLQMALGMLAVLAADVANGADSRYAHSDSNARFLHWIDLYDADGRKITPESNRPYSASKTCGRCHDYESISHGWHFNAFDPESVAGRRGEPWIWTDARTGTQLPLSYRDWSHTYQPGDLGITTWEMTKKFGARIPGGGIGHTPPSPDEAEPEDDSENDATEPPANRWPLTGSLEIDCMICHASSGAYDFNTRREQIEQENFAAAATAALHLGKIDGNVSRIKDGSDPNDESTQAKLPKVTYDPARFSPEGTVFMDLIRKPTSNACYQCHSQRTVDEHGIEKRWIHDEDVHLRAGMECTDCHRNGIDHHITRGFEGEQHPSQQMVGTLSCKGCHLGTESADSHGEPSKDIYARAGRLGSPKPAHAGLPPLHFEKLSCTACHGGPAPRNEAIRVMTSLAHSLGSKDHRTGNELPAILGPVYTKGEDGRVYPQRSMWPAFWGVVADGKITPIAPEKVYDTTRRTLRVRKDFVSELVKPKLSSKELAEVLGDERAKLDRQEWTDEDIANHDKLQSEEGRALFEEKVSAALEALEKELEVEQVVYVSAGVIYARDNEEEAEAGKLKSIEVDDPKATGMITWPLAHNVRPAGWSLGVGGCVECHAADGKIFASTVAAAGPGPDAGKPIAMAVLQNIPTDQRLAWNELFKGRKDFKYIVAGSIAVLAMILLIGIGAAAGRLAGRTKVASEAK